MSGAPPRVRVETATVPLLEAALAGDAALAEALGVDAVVEGWEVFPDTVAASRDLLLQRPHEAGWWSAFFVELGPPSRLVGFGGYKGPPAAGLVEIGYGIAPAARGRGLATEAARVLVERARADPRVEAVLAHTLPVESASTAVLAKLGFVRTATPVTTEGRVWRFRCPPP